jgi:Fe-Mn family superoxide dismutase
MSYSARDFTHLLGTPGLSDALLKNHFALYEGYVKNTNSLVEKLTELTKTDKMASPEYAEIKRRFGWELNGMKLHEIYFGNMTREKSALDEGTALAHRMKDDFGSVAKWQASFRAVGAMRGVGWALCCYDPEEDSLYNLWINEHNVNWPANAEPILLMDVWEHAFMLDYGIKRDGYIGAFMNAVDWDVAVRRFEAAAQKPALA